MILTRMLEERRKWREVMASLPPDYLASLRGELTPLEFAEQHKVFLVTAVRLERGDTAGMHGAAVLRVLRAYAECEQPRRKLRHGAGHG